MEGTAHSYEHVALLHDIGWALGQPHNETGAKPTREILTEVNYSQEKIGKIVGIVLHHPLDLQDKLETLEEKIVWDADKIDLLGAVGFARGFHWMGKKSFEAAVKLAFEVFTPIYGMLNTSTAREIAQKRYNETMSLLSALKEELSLQDLGIS